MTDTIRNNNYFGDCVICKACKTGYIDDPIYEGRCPNCKAPNTIAPSSGTENRLFWEVEVLGR